MGRVFLARQSGPMGFAKTVVVKTIHPHLARRKRFVDMFLDEARIAAQIHSRRVVQIHDLGVEGSQPYIAMEYLAGEDLGSLFRRGPLP
jgi:serine/threonine-protein kinase